MLWERLSIREIYWIAIHLNRRTSFVWRIIDRTDLPTYNWFFCLSGAILDYHFCKTITRMIDKCLPWMINTARMTTRLPASAKLRSLFFRDLSVDYYYTIKLIHSYHGQSTNWMEIYYDSWAIFYSKKKMMNKVYLELLLDLKHILPLDLESTKITVCYRGNLIHILFWLINTWKI